MILKSDRRLSCSRHPFNEQGFSGAIPSHQNRVSPPERELNIPAQSRPITDLHGFQPRLLFEFPVLPFGGVGAHKGFIPQKMQSFLAEETVFCFEELLPKRGFGESTQDGRAEWVVVSPV